MKASFSVGNRGKNARTLYIGPVHKIVAIPDNMIAKMNVSAYITLSSCTIHVIFC